MRIRIDIWLVCLFSLITFWQASNVHRWQIIDLLVRGTFLYSDAAWCFELFLTLYGYGIVFATVYTLYAYFRMLDDYYYNEDIASYLFFVLFGWIPEDRTPKIEPDHWTKVSSRARQRLELIICSSGLFAAYLVHGLVLEKITSQVYQLPDHSYTRFQDSQLLTYITCSACGFASLACLYVNERRIITRALVKYYKVSLVYVVGLWCQYEVLKFVGLPTVVLSTSFQVFTKRPKSGDQWVTLVLLLIGILFYLIHSSVQLISVVVALSGGALLLLRLVCDSYVATWQRRMGESQATTPVQMMFALNFFSCLLSAGAFIQFPKTAEAIALLKHPVFLVDCTLLVTSLAAGQLMMYRTIERFGALVFSLIMILRQVVTILLSCAVYGHSMSWQGAVGVALVFLTAFRKIYVDGVNRCYNKHLWI